MAIKTNTTHGASLPQPGVNRPVSSPNQQPQRPQVGVNRSTPSINQSPLQKPQSGSESQRENQKTYENNVENLHQYALAEDRASRADDEATRKLSSQISPPSKFRCYVGFFLSIVGDILDIVAFILVFVYGIGIPVGWAIDIVIDGPLLLLGFKSSKELKKIGAASSTITAKIQSIEQKVGQYRRRYAMILRASRKIKVLRRPVRQFAKKVKKIRKILTKSPVGRLITYMLADFVPFLDLIPFRTIAMRQMYKQEKLAYQEFQLLLNEDYSEARAEEVEATNDMIAIEQEEQEEEFSEEHPVAT